MRKHTVVLSTIITLALLFTTITKVCRADSSELVIYDDTSNSGFEKQCTNEVNILSLNDNGNCHSIGLSAFYVLDYAMVDGCLGLPTISFLSRCDCELRETGSCGNMVYNSSCFLGEVNAIYDCEPISSELLSGLGVSGDAMALRTTDCYSFPVTCNEAIGNNDGSGDPSADDGRNSKGSVTKRFFLGKWIKNLY
jgi:hypothetical protein